MNRVFSVLVLTGAVLFALAPAIAAVPAAGGILGPRVPVREGTSTNWAGYAVETNLPAPQNSAVTDVKGQWKVPAVTSNAANTYSSVWVGIDGYSDGTVEQLGTEQDWVNGNARYYAWIEMYPKLPSIINHPVTPGDTISAEVRYVGSNQFVLTITDSANGNTIWSFSTQARAKAQRQSAEWIVEAPSSGGVLPLANFGTVTIGGAQATLNGVTATINSSTWQNDPITMVTSSGTTKAAPSLLSSDGHSFSVTWHSN